MANRRMFSKTITNSSGFLMMAQSAQNLYFHFGMNADDDGFCEVFTIMRMTESKPDDLRVLQARGFVEVFDEKVLVILDWKENNYIQKDRYTPSKYLEIYKEELALISQKKTMDTECIQDVSKMDTQVRLGKVRLGKVNNSADAEVDKTQKSLSGSKEKKTKSRKPASPPLEPQVINQIDRDVQKLMCFFHDNGNPMINFGHKGQRNAAKDLIKKLGYEETEKWANFALIVSKRPFAPVITTPVALKNKFADLEVYRDRLIAEKGNTEVHVIKNNLENNE